MSRAFFGLRFLASLGPALCIAVGRRCFRLLLKNKVDQVLFAHLGITRETHVFGNFL